MNELPQAFASRRAPDARKRPVQAITAHDSQPEAAFSRPRYHCQEQADALRLVVHVPGADPSGIDLEVNAPDLIVTAARDESASAEWNATHPRLPSHDYQLCLRLGFSLAYEAIQAELHAGVLTVTIPKKAAVAAA